ncbi:hypothetical protein FQA39_LY13537 [Lamprigera yunnana]|nr:hypothetical protein FQA39_LY13537 [Lamprigera yunnana]
MEFMFSHRLDSQQSQNISADDDEVGTNLENSRKGGDNKTKRRRSHDSIVNEDSLLKLEVIAYIRLLIDQMLKKTKKVEYGAKKDRSGDGGSASGDGERKGGEEGERGPKQSRPI